MDENLGGNLGISLNVPIFNNMQVRGNVINQEFNLLNAELEQENREQQLLKKIQQAYQDVFISQASYSASEEQLTALQEATEYAQKRFDAGVIDFYTYMETVNNQTRAQSELLQAKYDFIVKMKVLDLYQGKPLTFE